jgi:hypothetical protein
MNPVLLLFLGWYLFVCVWRRVVMGVMFVTWSCRPGVVDILRGGVGRNWRNLTAVF